MVTLKNQESAPMKEENAPHIVTANKEKPLIMDIDQLRSNIPALSNFHDIERRQGANTIAQMAEPDLLSTQALRAKKIIYPGAPDQVSVDIFREIRTRLLQIYGGDNKITMISSVVPKGGATHVALNTAAAFAFDELKTALLVDCNIRYPALHERLYLEPEYGIVDFLEERVVGIDSIIYATGVPRLRVIPMGKNSEGAAEYFTSLRMRAFLDVVKWRYRDRYIFIDAPSIGNSADAKILASLCDCVLLVVPYAKVLESQVMSAVEAIGEDKLAGIIINN